jgi:hypothetical protein
MPVAVATIRKTGPRRSPTAPKRCDRETRRGVVAGDVDERELGRVAERRRRATVPNSATTSIGNDVARPYTRARPRSRRHHRRR